MSIQVKNINNILVIRCFDETDFHKYLDEIEKLLDLPLFNKECFYPKAFFDFGCRNLNENELAKLLLLLKEKKKVVFCGVNMDKKKNSIDMYSHILRNGDEIHIYNKTLFLSSIHSGSSIYCHDDVYFLNDVKGHIILMHNDVKVYGHHFVNAKISIGSLSMQNLTTSSFTSIYYKDHRIVSVYEEDEDGKNDNYYFR